MKSFLGSVVEAKTNCMQVGDLVSPCYFVELCDTIQLEELTDIFVVSDVGVLLAIFVDDRYHEGPEALMCQVLNPRGIVGWVCGKHINVV